MFDTKSGFQFELNIPKVNYLLFKSKTRLVSEENVFKKSKNWSIFFTKL